MRTVPTVNTIRTEDLIYTSDAKSVEKTDNQAEKSSDFSDGYEREKKKIVKMTRKQTLKTLTH
jgi:hypothetical protein